MNQRSEFVLRAVATDNFRELCREYGISFKTGYKWKKRFLAEGLAGMGDQSRRPEHSPGGLDVAVVCEMIRLKQAHPNWGPRKIRELYARAHERQAPSESSFKRILERAGLVEKRRPCVCFILARLGPLRLDLAHENCKLERGSTTPAATFR